MLNLKRRPGALLLGALMCTPATTLAAISGTLSITSTTHEANTPSTETSPAFKWTTNAPSSGAGTITYDYVLIADGDGTVTDPANIDELSEFLSAFNGSDSATLKNGTLAAGATSFTYSGSLAKDIWYLYILGRESNDYSPLDATTYVGPTAWLGGGSSPAKININTKPSVSSISTATLDHASTSETNVTVNGQRFMSDAQVTLVRGDTTIALTDESVNSTGDQISAVIPAPATYNSNNSNAFVPGTWDVNVKNTAANQSDSDNVSFSLTNNAPSSAITVSGNAVAGEQSGTYTLTISSGGSENIVLSGGSSADSDTGDTLSYAWETTAQPTGAGVSTTFTGEDPSSISVSTAGTYSFSLTASDNWGEADSTPATVTITVSESGGTANQSPSVSITVGEGDAVVAVNDQTDASNLTAVASDPDGEIATYQWAVVSKPSASNLSTGDISGATSTTYAFVPDKAGDYTLSVTVTDTGTTAATATEQVDITSNTPPTALAAATESTDSYKTSSDATIYRKLESVQLSGTGSSDADTGDDLTYVWSVTTEPSGSDVASQSEFDSSSATPTFSPTVSGAYTFSLTVNDGTENSATPSTKSLTVNTRPTANAGDNTTATGGSSKSLTGGATDADTGDDTFTYAWTITTVPTGACLSTGTGDLTGATSAGVSFTPRVNGTFVLGLTVNDGEHNSAQDTVNVVVSGGQDQCFNLDVDGDGTADALTDGILILRHLFGFTGTTLTANATATGATRDSAAIGTQLTTASTGTLLDADGDGTEDALTDGILILRHLFGFTGTTLSANATAAGASRTSGSDITTYLDNYAVSQ